MNGWTNRFLQLAETVGSWSKDPSTKAGAVLVAPNRRIVSVGFNGFCQKMPDKEENYADRIEKYSRIIHAEINALIFAGHLPDNTVSYTWPFLPCDRCVVQLIQAGVVRFVAPKPTEDVLSRWAVSLAKTKQYISECGLVWAEL